MSIREYSKLQFKSVSSSKTTRDDSRSTKPSMILQMRKLWKIEDSVASSRPFDPVRVSAFKVKLEPQKWPAPIFPPPRQRGFRGMDATVHAIFRQFLPTADLSYPFLLPGTLWRGCLRPKTVCAPCLDFHRVKWPSANSFLFFFLFFFLLLFFELSTRRRRKTNGKRRKFVAGSLISPVDALM